MRHSLFGYLRSAVGAALITAHQIDLLCVPGMWDAWCPETDHNGGYRAASILDPSRSVTKLRPGAGTPGCPARSRPGRNGMASMTAPR